MLNCRSLSHKVSAHTPFAGHAEDLRQSGANLLEMLRAGDWASAAFMAYLNQVELECDAAAEAQAGFSDSEVGAIDG